MSKATSIYIDADACPLKAGIVVFPAVTPNGSSVIQLAYY